MKKSQKPNDAEIDPGKPGPAGIPLIEFLRESAAFSAEKCGKLHYVGQPQNPSTHATHIYPLGFGWDNPAYATAYATAYAKASAVEKASAGK